MTIIIRDATVKEFRGSYSFLSNFYPAEIKYERLTFPTVENAYQAAKCAYKENMLAFTVCSPSRAKKLGREVKIIQNWENRKVAIMKDLLRQKFTISDLRHILLATGSALLIEGNYWGDEFWGVCKGKGLNILGNLLMEIRAEISAQTSQQSHNPPSDEVPI